MGERMDVNRDSVSIVLVRPKFAENVGSAARAMKNMGFQRLLIVDGSCPIDMKAYKLASGAEEVLERAEEFSTLEEAVAEMGCVVGTTSRGGKERGPLINPRVLARRLVPISKKNPIGLVFGSEREGLTNRELSFCHLFVKIPASESFPSLNLAQAVMILCYELFQTSGEPLWSAQPLAPSVQVEGMYDQMEKTLIDIGFLDSKNPRRMMKALRKVFGRSHLDEREVRILRGILSQIDWFVKKTIKTIPDRRRS
jgi:tRNA/rRNA methyltransferase